MFSMSSFFLHFHPINYVIFQFIFHIFIFHLILSFVFVLNFLIFLSPILYQPINTFLYDFNCSCLCFSNFDWHRIEFQYLCSDCFRCWYTIDIHLRVVALLNANKWRVDDDDIQDWIIISCFYEWVIQLDH